MNSLCEELKEKGYENFIQTLEIMATLKILSRANLLPFLADGYSKMESSKLRVNEVIMNASTYAHIRKLGKDIIDFEVKTEKLKQGIMARIWGAVILITKEMPNDTMLVLSDAEKRTTTILKLDLESSD